MPTPTAPTAERPQRLGHHWRPAPQTVITLALLGLGALTWALMARVWPPVDAPWVPPLLWLLLTGLIAGILLDAHAAWRRSPLVLERHMLSGLALNEWASVRLSVHHTFTVPVRITLFDGIHGALIAEGARSTVPLQPGQHTVHAYRLRPLVRGPLTLSECHVQIPTPLGFGLIRYRAPLRSEARVYPNFTKVSHYQQLVTLHRTSALGIRPRNRRGQGLDFHQLRDYRPGDSLRQIDWNATARRQQPIAREYQDERDQPVILLIDSGHRMRCRDHTLEHFDHALNAGLLLSHTALSQGDRVGILCFGHTERWIPPQKGSDRLRVLLNGLYDAQAGNTAPDYLAAATRLEQLQHKRALLVLLTNLRDREDEELFAAVQLLQRRHQVLVASLQETDLAQVCHTPVTDLASALTYAGTIDYLRQRQQMLHRLRHQGVQAVDCLPAELPAALINRYWAIKRAGAL